MSKDESGFIVNAWKQIFGSLNHMSIFTVVRYFVTGGRGGSRFSEMYTLVNFFLSIAYLLLIPLPSTKRCVTIIILVYPTYRIFEIMVYHINIFLSFGELHGIRRSIILLLHNYIEVLFWFASFYRLLPYCFSHHPFVAGTLSGSLYFSLVTMSTLGYGDIRPINEIGRLIVSSQTLIGIFMAIFILGSFVKLLPPRKTMDKEEKGITAQDLKETIRLVIREWKRK